MMVRSAYPLSSGDCLSSLACLSSKLLTLTVLMDDAEDVDAGTCSLMNLNNGDSSSILAYREVKSVEWQSRIKHEPDGSMKSAKRWRDKVKKQTYNCRLLDSYFQAWWHLPDNEWMHLDHQQTLQREQQDSKRCFFVFVRNAWMLIGVCSRSNLQRIGIRSFLMHTLVHVTRVLRHTVEKRNGNAGETYTAECRLPKNLKHKEELTL